ncbi:DNA-binding transcriptional MerR regulator [Diaminobutyricimonas aerilata]|uniref:DNA-binding transcriptional MerR regulator n=1 Tax=Diaminobutyricimonas aerilata TaxID=1162967 RepID=A0A2M9CKC5_9MICO|nr:HEAT repeat domain-containing protein [Diaminobutyricimonas aerilata]PJJ72354.1 DNA-binding transcriptional MerR regulator [Diaminobutyricimonas aerilata]
MLIGEVSARSGISTRMLRHYDRVGLLSPSGREHGAYRRYSDDDVRRLFYIESLRSLGLTLREVALALADPSFDPASVVERLLVGTRARLARERELLDRLERVHASAPDAWSDVLRTVGLVRGLDAEDPSTRQRIVLSGEAAAPADVARLAEAALRETDPNAAGALDWALARIGESAVPLLVAALDSSDPDRRRRAIEALAKHPSPEAEGALVQSLRHVDPVVRARAALASGARGVLEAVPLLLALVADGRGDVEASEVLGSLAVRHGQADAVARLIADESVGAPDAARVRLAAALAEVPGSIAASILTAFASDPDPRVAGTATFLLAARSPEG